MLFLIATPIGNLSDFSFRAVETLKQCDYLLCEDTRRSQILLKHYQISKPLFSFHLFNEKKKEERVVADLKQGKVIGLLSDAGTPGIADPGAELIARCRMEGIQVIPLPGPCAAIVALSASGLPTTRFQFVGFLPKTKGKLKKAFSNILDYPGTTICYESPWRVIKTMNLLLELAPERRLVLAKELTKKFELFIQGTAQEILNEIGSSEIKGEIILLISPPVEN